MTCAEIKIFPGLVIFFSSRAILIKLCCLLCVWGRGVVKVTLLPAGHQRSSDRSTWRTESQASMGKLAWPKQAWVVEGTSSAGRGGWLCVYLCADDANNLSAALLKIFPKLIILLSLWGLPKYLLEKGLTHLWEYAVRFFSLARCSLQIWNQLWGRKCCGEAKGAFFLA